MGESPWRKGDAYKRINEVINLTAKSWQKKIKTSCEAAGTYRPFFDDVIVSLANILEQRDTAKAQFEKSGGAVVISYTNKGGATNPAKNPFLVAWDDLNKTALSYWRELGLTPAGLKKINENAMKIKKKSALSEVMKGVE